MFKLPSLWYFVMAALGTLIQSAFVPVTALSENIPSFHPIQSMSFNMELKTAHLVI